MQWRRNHWYERCIQWDGSESQLVAGMKISGQGCMGMGIIGMIDVVVQWDVCGSIHNGWGSQ